MDKTTHQIRCEQWMQIMNDCAASGMGKGAWCRANGISEKAFFYWQRILRNEAYLEQTTMPAVTTARQETQVAFVELKSTMDDNNESSGFRPDVIIRNKDIVLEISNTVSPELMKLLGGILHAE